MGRPLPHRSGAPQSPLQRRQVLARRRADRAPHGARGDPGAYPHRGGRSWARGPPRRRGQDLREVRPGPRPLRPGDVRGRAGPLPEQAHRAGPRRRAEAGPRSEGRLRLLVRAGGDRMNRVLLLDDHATFREPLAFMLNWEPEFEVVAQAGSLAEARRAREGIDLAIVDLNLPDGNGTELIGELRAANPHGMVLVLTASAEREAYARAVEAGAAGVLNKSASIKDVIEAARRLAAGEAVLSTDEISELLRIAGRRREQDRETLQAVESLTPREREVLGLLAEGLSDKEIADRLYVGSGTVRNHVVSVFGKLGVHSRLQALVFAVRHGIVDVV